MSQNKTVIQGLEPDGGNYEGTQIASDTNLYGRNSNSARGTIVPGMIERDEVLTPQRRESVQRDDLFQIASKPIVGFLYSISRTSLGEFWPVQIGRNTIGQSEECDVCLPEGTVSSNHAVLMTRQVKNQIIAAVTDSQSTNGTKINGEMIGFTPEECHDGDIITVGNNYELLFILIDSAQHGLFRSKNFIPVEVERSKEEECDDIPSFQPGDTANDFAPYHKNSSDWEGESRNPVNGTVGFDGSMSGGNHGGTIPM